MTYVPAEHKTDGQRQTNLTPISFILNEVKDFQNIHIIILNQYTEYVWLMSFYEPHTLKIESCYEQCYFEQIYALFFKQ